MVDFKKADAILLNIGRSEVEEGYYGDISRFVKMMEDMGSEGFQKASLMFAGYDDDIREIFEIDEIRRFVKVIFKKYPHLLYFMNPLFESDVNLLSCYCELETIYNGERKLLKDWFAEGKTAKDLPRFHSIFYLTEEDYMRLQVSLTMYADKVGDRLAMTVLNEGAFGNIRLTK